MTERELLIEILRKPIFPHELVDPLEAVTDYLLDNGVTIPVRCKDCKWYAPNNDGCWVGCAIAMNCKEDEPEADDFCSFGERRTDD